MSQPDPDKIIEALRAARASGGDNLPDARAGAVNLHIHGNIRIVTIVNPPARPLPDHKRKPAS